MSGHSPGTLSLGTHHLGDQVRLAWRLSGSRNDGASFTLDVERPDGSAGYSASVDSGSFSGALPQRDDSALALEIPPGDYNISFGQRLVPPQVTGYDVQYTLYTTKSPP